MNKIESFNIGTREGNYQILKLLPSSIKELQKKMNLSKMPMNRRVNDLEAAGLVKRDKGYGIMKKGMVSLTELGKELIVKVGENKK